VTRFPVFRGVTGFGGLCVAFLVLVGLFWFLMGFLVNLKFFLHCFFFWQFFHRESCVVLCDGVCSVGTGCVFFRSSGWFFFHNPKTVCPFLGVSPLPLFFVFVCVCGFFFFSHIHEVGHSAPPLVNLFFFFFFFFFVLFPPPAFFFFRWHALFFFAFPPQKKPAV